MAFSQQGYANKRERLRHADEKVTRPEGEYQKTMFFSKGDRRGVLAVWEHRMEWQVYADPLFTMHVDWKDPDCTCLECLGSPVTILHVLSAIHEQGFVFTNERV